VNLTVVEIAAATGGKIIKGTEDRVLTGIAMDTRTIRVGGVFFALIGESRDGHSFLTDAVGRGAAALVVSKIPKAATGDAAVVLVGDTLRALGDLAAAHRRKFNISVAAITGSVGKTTTKEMTAAVLGTRGITIKNLGNFNNEIGLPLTIFEITPEHKYAVLEMAMRGPGEIDRLAEIAQPEVGVITNIGISHMERLGSIEAIARAKGELLGRLPRSGAAALDADSEWWDFLSRLAPCPIIGFGFSGRADVRGGDLILDEKGCPTFNVMIEGRLKPVPARLAAPGEHNAKNALAAIAAGLHFGVSPDEAAEALRYCSLPEMRMNVTTTSGGITVIDDTYNASPASMTAALRLMNSLRGRRKIAVLGDMLELGEQSAAAHKEVGELAVQLGAKILIAVGERAVGITEGAKSAGMAADAIISLGTSEDVAEALRPRLESGDVVLVKGSRAIKMELAVEGLLAE